MTQWSRNMKVLQVLARHEEGLYGSDLRRLIPGWFVGGWVYDTLEKLVDSGLVYEIVEHPGDTRMLPRTRHFITQIGIALVEEAYGQA